MSRNIESAGPQANVNAARDVGKQTIGQSDAESKAQQFASQRMSEVLYANDSGSALMRLNAEMQSPDKDKFLNGIATGKAMTAGMNPDLGAHTAEQARYISPQDRRTDGMMIQNPMDRPEVQYLVPDDGTGGRSQFKNYRR